jgi:hypothetical protein
MNNFSDEDPKLLNFLRQYRWRSRSVHADARQTVTSEPTASEDLLMAEIDLLPIEPRSQVSRHWWRYIVGGIGIIATGIVGVTMHQLLNPSEPSLAELQQLNLYLEAHVHSLNDNPETGVEDRSNLSDLDLDIFSDNDNDESVDG